MKKYKYETIKFVYDFSIESTIDEMADEGWRFVSMVYSKDYDYILVFEKEI